MDIYPQICFVYKWTQLSTGKWYIGSHTRKDAHPNNGYICTSKIVKPMIKENPNDWVRIILETGSADDMVTLECEILTCLDAAKSKYSYNGHNGGAKFTFTGKTHSVESNIKNSNAHKGKYQSIDTCNKISDYMLTHTRSLTHKQNCGNARRGKSLPEEHVNNMLKGMSKGIYELTSPNGMKFTNHSLAKICINLGLPFQTMRKYINSGIIPPHNKSGKKSELRVLATGWSVTLIVTTPPP
jgi:hypothetical protein